MPIKHGKQLSHTRLTDNDIRGIRLAGQEGVLSQESLAETYGVTQAYISMVLAGKRRPGIKPRVEKS